MIKKKKNLKKIGSRSSVQHKAVCEKPITNMLLNVGNTSTKIQYQTWMPRLTTLIQYTPGDVTNINHARKNIERNVN